MNMATPRNPGALKSAVGAWGDVRETLTWLFTPALIAFLLLLTLESVKTLIMPLPNSTAAFELKRLSYEAVKMVLLVPYIIAVHRFIILGEITTGYRIAIGKPRPWRFSGWSLAFLVVGNSPTTLSVLLPGEAPLEDILGVVLGILTTVAAIPAMVLFPAVAVDAPGANWRQAILDTYAHVWDIVLTTIAAMLPWIVVAVLGREILQSSVPADTAIAFDIFDAIVVLVGCTLGAVVASRIYQRIGAHVLNGRVQRHPAT